MSQNPEPVLENRQDDPTAGRNESLTSKYLLIRLLILSVLAGLALLIWPEARWVLFGLPLGFLYAFSLIVTKRVDVMAANSGLHTFLFFASSLLRIVLFGYALLWISDAEPKRLLLVLAGFLGYSSWVFIERLLWALGYHPLSRKIR